MYWSDSEKEAEYKVPDDVFDLMFRIDCPRLPQDHAFALSQAVCRELPWLETESNAGVHLIHGGNTANGWQRPADSIDEIMHLSRRTRFIVRIPKVRLADAQALEGKTLQVDGYELVLGASHSRLLSPLTTIFSRHVVVEKNDSEDDFINRTVAHLRDSGIGVRKLLCGMPHSLSTPDGPIYVRSVMLANLDRDHSVLLQQRGIGQGRTLGCGIFLPHKGIDSVE